MRRRPTSPASSSRRCSSRTSTSATRRSRLGPTGALRAPGSHAFSFVFQSFIDELAHAAEGSGAVPPRPAGQQGVSAARARGRRVQRGSHGRRREDDCREVGMGHEEASQGTGMGIGFQYSHRGYFAEVAEVRWTRASASRSTRCGLAATSAARSSARCTPRTWCRAA